jgi:hypothetical protein
MKRLLIGALLDDAEHLPSFLGLPTIHSSRLNMLAFSRSSLNSFCTSSRFVELFASWWFNCFQMPLSRLIGTERHLAYTAE